MRVYRTEQASAKRHCRPKRYPLQCRRAEGERAKPPSISPFVSYAFARHFGSKVCMWCIMPKINQMCVLVGEMYASRWQACGGACSNEREKCQKVSSADMFHFHVRCRDARARAKLSHARLSEERDRLPWLATNTFLARERRTLTIWIEAQPSASR